MANTIKQLIENPHPIFKKYYSYWNFLIDAYEGGVDYTQADVQRGIVNSADSIIQVKVNGKPLEDKMRANIFKHKKERDADYLERVQMSYYYNFCAPIIDIYTNHLFKEPVIQDWADVEIAVENRENNIDRKGSSLSEFRREMAELAQIYGHIFVLVDKPRTEAQIVSLAQQQEAGMFPYFTFFRPTDVINWALDEFGNAHWVLLQENLNGNINPFEFDKDNMNMVQYRLWTRNEWVLYNSKFEEIERATHGLGSVPIGIVFNKPSKKHQNYLGISEIADIAFIARDVYNKCSELNEIIRNQTFSILTLQGNSKDYNELSVGTSKALLYPKETNVPQYISPAAENAETLMKQIDRQVHKMFQLAKLEGGSATQTEQIDSQSGISKAFDFQETNSALAKKAGHMEDGELRMWDLFARWEGKKEFAGSVSYPRDFNIQELNDELDEAEKLMKLSLGNEFNIQMKKEIIKKKFPRITDEERDKMIREVETSEGKTEGVSLRERLPGLFGRANNNNAVPGGNNGGKDNEKFFKKTV